VADEIEMVRRFIDETPGPSTDAWARARAAIATARAEEEPARHRPGWLPGGRPPGREHCTPTGLPGPVGTTARRRRMLVIGAGGAVAAAVAGLLVALLPGSPGTGGPGARIETTAFVTRVERALSESGQRNLIEYDRSVYPPGYNGEPVAPDMIPVPPGSGGPSSPWSVRYLESWSYRGTSKVSAFTAAGRRVFDVRDALVHGMSTTTAVLYRSGTWWRATHPGSAANGQAPTPCGGSDILVGPGGWPAFLRHELSCGAFTKGGRQRIGGIDAIELTGNGGREMFWVNPQTYLPVRAIVAISAGARFRTDFGWFTPTQARLAELNLRVPPGFRQVSPLRFRRASAEQSSHR